MRSRAGRTNPSALPGPGLAGGARTELNLFADTAPEAEWLRFDRHATGNFAWHGRLLDDPLSAVTLTIVGDARVLQVISPKHGHFEVLSRRDGRSVIRQFDPERLKGDGNDFVQTAGFGARGVPPAEEPESPALLGDGVAGVTIDVLMVYSTRARQLAGSRPAIVALAQAAVNGENSNFSRSDISHRMRLVQAREVSHTTTGNLATELGWVAGNSTVASMRDDAGADIVAFLSDKDDTGTYGIAFQLTSTSGNSGQAFSACYYDTVGGVWPHEVGHNLGCQHNAAGVYSYSSGHYWLDDGGNGNTYGSLMSYIGIRVPYFSNPDVKHWTGTTGTASRDNARSIDNIGDHVAGYRAAKTLIEPSCAISSSTTKPREGIDFTLTITAVNGGPSAATAGKIAVTLPSQLTLVSHDGGTAFNTGTKVWDVPDLANGATAKLVLTLRPTSGSAGVSLTPKATITSVGSGFVDFDVYNNEGTVTFVVAPAPTTDLVLHYALDEASGKIAHDASTVEGGTQNAATTNAAPQWQPAGGIIGGALRLTPNAQADVGQSFSFTSSSPMLYGYPFTLALWARATPGTWYQVCAMLGDQTLGSSYFELSLYSERAQLMARNTAQVWAKSPVGLPVTDGAWHHLAGVYSSATLRVLFVDGMPVATNTTSVGFVTNNKRFSLGALMRDVPTQSFPGDLDDIGLWSTALAPERIALIHALGRYSAADLDDPAIGTLLAVHAAHSGFAGAGGVVWVPATGLSGPVGCSGSTNGQPYLVLNASGEGLIGLTRPALSLSGLSGGSISLSWPSGFADWILQESTEFWPADWQDSTQPVNDSGLMRTTDYPLLDLNRQFFRLVKP